MFERASSARRLSSRFAGFPGLAGFAGLALAVALAVPASAQPEFLTGPQNGDPLDIALGYLEANAADYGLTAADLDDLEVTDRYTSSGNGVTHIYLRQRYQGIPVFNGVINVNVTSDGSLINLGNRFVGDLAGKINVASPTVGAEEAIRAAARHLDLGDLGRLEVVEVVGGPASESRYSGAGFSQDDVPIHLAWQRLRNGRVRLAWQLVIHTLDGSGWWDIRVDALNGDVLDQNNWIANEGAGEGGVPADRYLVSPAFFESIGHAGETQTGIVGPADPTASPFGWHDTDGDVDPDYTDTRGNNVLAQEDLDANNSDGARPSGGAGPVLDFDWLWDKSKGPAEDDNLDASIVNLFYWNNVMHDLTYQYGFDEASGNFQGNTYGNGGLGSDAVDADALDGSGTNNANFGTPPDGSRPRMQMFVWMGPRTLTVNAPAGIAGDYLAAGATFGADLDATGVSGDVVYVNDGTGNIRDGCQAITNNVSGKLALIDRGSCEFGVKVLNAQNAGAIGAIVVNNVAGGVFTMTGGAVGHLVTIPSVMISMADGTTIKGETGVNSTAKASTIRDRDSDFDAGVIAHEYGHGISNRLTGGPANVGCLSGSEQAGEGWSDFWTLALFAKATDTATTTRAVGTYVLFQPPTGSGIRNFPYTTDLAVNPQTYEDIGSTNVPHGVGEIWAAMLWEVYWNLVDTHGFDADLYGGSGGNNLAIQLVVDGMKMQPCDPTFVDARDAILLADAVDNGGANECDIWRGFAKRGLGLAAVDGSNGVGDETEDFTVPAECDVDPALIFSDGFESGDTTVWSNTIP